MFEFVKHSLKRKFPDWYEQLYSTKAYVLRQSRIEFRVLRQIARKLIRGEGDFRSWRQVLPMQACRYVELPDLDFGTLDKFLEALKALGLEYSHSESTVYLPPRTFQHDPLRTLSACYPPKTGLKIFSVSLKGTSAVGSDPALERQLNGSLILIANILYREGLGSRLYDVIEIRCRDSILKAYVIEHVSDNQLSATEREPGMSRLKQLEKIRLIKRRERSDSLINSQDRPEPNILADSAGRFRCVSAESFDLIDYEQYLTDIALEAGKNTNFGEQSLLMGERYLYQSIPGVRLPAKRTCSYRIVRLEQMMGDCGLSVLDRLVLDIGCNVGVMMAEYLKRGAKWCHGWDSEKAIPYTDAVLLALGCTRFSTTGTFIESTRRIEDDMADFVANSLPGCVISYLAIRHHVGWLEALGRIPWSFMIYEGHQYETKDNLCQFVGQLREIIDIDIAQTGSYADGYSGERMIAIFVNKNRKK